MVFLDEEREKEMEGLFESELDRDDVAAPGADGLAPPPQRKPEGETFRLVWCRRGGLGFARETAREHQPGKVCVFVCV